MPKPSLLPKKRSNLAQKRGLAEGHSAPSPKPGEPSFSFCLSFFIGQGEPSLSASLLLSAPHSQADFASFSRFFFTLLCFRIVLSLLLAANIKTWDLAGWPLHWMSGSCFCKIVYFISVWCQKPAQPSHSKKINPALVSRLLFWPVRQMSREFSQDPRGR